MVYKMKNNINKLLFALVIMVSFNLKANADCSYIEKARLNEVASKVRTNYEVIEDKVTVELVDPEEDKIVTVEKIKTSFKITIYNLSEDIYVVETNDLNKDKKFITSDDIKNGVYSFTTDDVENIVKYEYTIHASKEECSGDILKSYTFIKPKENHFNQYTICNGLEDLPYCKPFLTEDLKVGEAELEKQVLDYLNKTNKKEEENKKGNFFKNNYIYIISGVVVVGGTAAGVYFYIKKRRTI